MQPTLRHALDALHTELIKHSSHVDAEIHRRERPRMPDAQGRPGLGPIDPDGMGAGWGSFERERRTATANLSNALRDACDAVSRALTAVGALSTLPAAPIPDASSAEAK